MKPMTRRYLEVNEVEAEKLCQDDGACCTSGMVPSDALPVSTASSQCTLERLESHTFPGSLGIF